MGKAFGWIGVIQSLGAGIGYAYLKDWRRSTYYFLAAGINLTIIL